MPKNSDHVKSIKPGKVVIILAGRYAGKKAIVVKTWDDGNKQREFSHCLVSGIDKTPMPVTKSMSKNKITRRSRIKPFVKYVNYNHIMPTRYNVNDFDLRAILKDTVVNKADSKAVAVKTIKQQFEQRYIKRVKNNNGLQ